MNKKIISLLILPLFLLLVSSVKAVDYVSITQLNSYTKTNNFTLSCSALKGTTAQFSFKKDGGSYTDFGGLIDLTTSECKVSVSGAQITEQAKYFFKVTTDVGSAETSTTYDTNGPGTVSGYYKDGLGDGYKLHFHTPSDTDFAKVIIYRGDTEGFEADSGHEIATIAAGADSDMTYEDHAGANKYYYIRAVDKAGNSSGLVGDTSTTTSSSVNQNGESSSPGSGSQSVTQLPQEGSVLGSENENMEESGDGAMMDEGGTSTDGSLQTTGGVANWISSHKLLTILLAALAGVIFYTYNLLKPKK